MIALALSMLFALAIAELVSRSLFGTPMAERLPLLTVRANPARGWEMVPGLPHYTYLHPVRVNQLGLRGAEIASREHAPDELRVLALGDSLVYGQGVTDTETLPAHLELELRARDREGRRWRVINGGHRAYDTRQELALLEELGPAIDPDVVVLFWFWNDLKERDVDATYRRLAASGPIVFDTGGPLRGREELEWHLLQLVRRSALVMTAHDRFRARFAEPPGPSFVEEGFRRLAGYLRAYRDLARRRGFAPLLAAIPDPNAALASHWSSALADRACRAAEDAGVPSLSLEGVIAELLAQKGKLPILPYDGHYDTHANAALAAAVADFVLAHALSTDLRSLNVSSADG